MKETTIEDTFGEMKKAYVVDGDFSTILVDEDREIVLRISEIEDTDPISVLVYSTGLEEPLPIFPRDIKDLRLEWGDHFTLEQ